MEGPVVATSAIITSVQASTISMIMKRIKYYCISNVNTNFERLTLRAMKFV